MVCLSLYKNKHCINFILYDLDYKLIMNFQLSFFCKITICSLQSLNMNVAILYIGLSKYDIFWNDFYLSFESFFLKDIDKHYFVFSDSQKIKNNFNVSIISQMDMGWPFNTLYRFKMFLRIKDELINYDYIFFFNANMKCLDFINSDDILNAELIVLNHPGYWNSINETFPLEQHKSSTAYLTHKSVNQYYQGSFNGGKTTAYLDLIQTCHDNIEKDINNGIIAIWHDESHLNKYLVDKQKKVLSPAYGYPEGWNLPFKPKILILDKDKYGGHDYLRGSVNYPKNKIKQKLVKFIRKLSF
jgi:hypothetical protein